jgi:L-2,4-diaminobutyrate decarboxylase
MRSHLLNEATTGRYRRSVAEAVERVAATLAATGRPFTGITPDALAPRIDAIDLDRPLGDTAAALEELESVYLRDAVYFHHPRYLAHLSCPVVIPRSWPGCTTPSRATWACTSWWRPPTPRCTASPAR